MRKPSIAGLKKQIARLESKLTQLKTQLETQLESQRKLSSAFSLTHVAKLMRVHPYSVKRLIDDGRLKGFRLHPRGKWYITKRSLNKFCQQLSSKCAQDFTHNGNGTPA